MAVHPMKSVKNLGSEFAYLQNANGCALESRIVAHKMLGRPIKSTEVVWHIDQDPSNNKPDNLMVFKSRSDIAAYQNGCDAIEVDNVYFCPDKSIRFANKTHGYKICPKCGKFMTQEASRCKACDSYAKRVTERPDFDTLLKYASVCNYCELGLLLGVSDNAVRKWVKEFGLPCNKSDLTTYAISYIADKYPEYSIWKTKTQNTGRIVTEYLPKEHLVRHMAIDQEFDTDSFFEFVKLIENEYVSMKNEARNSSNEHLLLKNDVYSKSMSLFFIHVADKEFLTYCNLCSKQNDNINSWIRDIILSYLKYSFAYKRPKS